MALRPEWPLRNALYGPRCRVLDAEIPNWEAADASERRLASALAPLSTRGFHILSDRRWPQSRRAQVDFVVVGPSGVYIVDAKTWSDVTVVRSGAETRIFRGDDDVTDDFQRLRRLARGTEDALLAIGYAPTQVSVIASFTNRDDITARVDGVEIMGEAATVRHIARQPRVLTPTQAGRVLQHLLDEFPPMGAPEEIAVVVRSGPQEPTEIPVVTQTEIEESLLEGALREPIEDWMVFLHPDQAKIVRRSFNGPSRIRGAAGTGKTVVGLHRAAYLAQTSPGRVLVTSFVRTLPQVLASLMHRMAPDVADRIDFVNVHAFARRALEDRGIRSRLDSAAAEAAFGGAWNHEATRTPLLQIVPDVGYWKDEMRSVIKGRGITTLEGYLDCARAGRRQRLTADQRRSVWALFTRYERELRRRDAWDFHDLILQARTALVDEPCTDYSAVVIDEAQDLSCAMVQLLHSLVGDAPDGLNLIGDGQQNIYPGGYVLSEIGISIAGRGVVMDRNYRNTVEIAAYAASLIDGDEFVDLEGTSSAADAAVVTRRGTAPQVVRFETSGEHDRALVDHVEALIADGVRVGDIAVLARSAYLVPSSELHDRGILTQDLEEYDGSPVDAVKIGTIKRSKGLEFAQVLLARAPRATGLSGGDSTDRQALDARELFVAATRARDGLWVGVV